MINARDLYRDLAIPHFHIAFTDWFTANIESKFKKGEDWRVDGDGDDLHFLITQETYDQVSFDVLCDEIEGRMIFKKKGMSSESLADLGWNQENNPQTHAITGDEDGS